MFAILLSKEMDPFYQIITAYPTVLFTVGLLLAVVFWGIAVLGLVDIGILDVADAFDFDIDAGTVPDGVAGVVLRFHLDGVPLTISLSFIFLLGWIFSYFGVYFCEGLNLFWPLGIVLETGIFFLSLFMAIKITSFLIRPLKPFFKHLQKHSIKVLIGKTAVVRTLRLDANFGEVYLEDGEAGLVLKARSFGAEYKKGDRVVLVEYNKEKNNYHVVIEDEFNKNV